jgi:hypothetical protein
MEYQPLQRCPYLLFHDIQRPKVQLGDITVSSGPVGTWGSIAAEVCLEVQSEPTGFSARLIIRTDVYPIEIADTIVGLFVEAIGEGPERLAARTSG